MRKFDFNHPSFGKHSKGVQELVRHAFEGELSKKEFIALYRKLPKKLHRSKKRNNYAARKTAERLEKVYGFQFKG